MRCNKAKTLQGIIKNLPAPLPRLREAYNLAANAAGHP